MSTKNQQRQFGLACAFELALLGVAAALGWLLQQPLLVISHWHASDTALGIAGTVPLLVLFWWMLRTRLPPLSEIRDFLEAVVRPMFCQWTIPQLAVISLLAGVSEEALFRAVIQGSLTSTFGVKPALALASVLFGACHFVNWAYAIIATFIGLFLGMLWLFTGTLLAPLTTHAVYDFVALVYFVRICQPRVTPAADAG